MLLNRDLQGDVGDYSCQLFPLTEFDPCDPHCPPLNNLLSHKSNLISLSNYKWHEGDPTRPNAGSTYRRSSLTRPFWGVYLSVKGVATRKLDLGTIVEMHLAIDQSDALEMQCYWSSLGSRGVVNRYDVESTSMKGGDEDTLRIATWLTGYSRQGRLSTRKNNGNSHQYRR